MNEVEQKIKEIFLNIFPELSFENYDPKKNQEEYQDWDSFSHMELVSGIENDLGVSLEMDEIVEVKNAQDFVDLVNKKKA